MPNAVLSLSLSRYESLVPKSTQCIVIVWVTCEKYAHMLAAVDSHLAAESAAQRNASHRILADTFQCVVLATERVASALANVLHIPDLVRHIHRKRTYSRTHTRTPFLMSKYVNGAHLFRVHSEKHYHESNTYTSTQHTYIICIHYISHVLYICNPAECFRPKNTSSIPVVYALFMRMLVHLFHAPPNMVMVIVYFSSLNYAARSCSITCKLAHDDVDVWACDFEHCVRKRIRSTR